MDTDAILDWLREQREEVEASLDFWKKCKDSDILPSRPWVIDELKRDLSVIDAIIERVEGK
jgi:hypothetical protein